MRWISVNFTDMSHEGMRSQTFDLLTPQPFGRDRIFDDVFSDEIVSSELCGHVRKCEARCSTSAAHEIVFFRQLHSHIGHRK